VTIPDRGALSFRSGSKYEKFEVSICWPVYPR
jgi:hypothetical protein